MKPLLLKMTAFGPYKDSVSVDFTKFGDRLFLIEGPTGAGKTTIFDAICYALYNEPSGGYRKNFSLRSQFASPDVQTSVSLSFLYHGKEYLIARTPDQYILKKNGVGLAHKNPTVELTGPDFSPITNINVAKAKIAEIIGLTKEEFENTMMIAQGDFSKLINAQTSERQAIFRKILKTYDLKAFIDSLNEKDKDSQAVVEGQNHQIIGLFQSIQDGPIELANLLKQDEAIDHYDEMLSLCESSIEQNQENLKPLLDKASLSEKAKQEMLLRHQKSLVDNKNAQDYLNASSSLKELQMKAKEHEEEEESVEPAINAALVISSSKALDKTKDEVKELEKKKDSLAIDLPEANKTYDETKKVHDERHGALEKEKADLLGEKATLESSKKKLDDLQAVYARFTEALSEQSTKKSSFDAVQSEATKLQKEQDELTIKINSYADEGEEEKEESLLNDIKLKKADLLTLQNDFASLKESERTVTAIQANYVNSERAYVAINSEAQNALSLYLSAQAGVLAEVLKSGEACPVCGSTEHPHLAHKVEGVKTKDEIDALSKKAEQAKLETTRLSGEAQKQLGVYEEKKAALLASAKKALNKESSLDSLEDDVRSSNMALDEAFKIANEALLAAKAKKEKHVEDIKRQSALAESIKKKQDETNKASSSLAESNNEVGKIMTEKNGLEKDTKGLSKDEVEGRLNTIGARLFSLGQDEKNLEKNLTEISGKVASLREAKDENDEALPLKVSLLQKEENDFMALLAKYHFVDLSEAQKAALPEEILRKRQEEARSRNSGIERLSGLVEDGQKKGYDKLMVQPTDNFASEEAMASEEAKNDADAVAELSGKIQANAETLKKIKSSYDLSKDLLEKATMIHRLAQTANGKLTGGTAHIDFEVYYQAQIFDEILANASKKFQVMSDGRYTLLRREAPQNNRGDFGLDVDVLDYETGKSRPASSLSGGESFMASLSLALSLSEVIQQKAGGIELDSMFIDEGFGSLDPESLALAVKILTGLSNNNHRLIGIISHVESLKDKIPAQINVSKGQQGSSISCHLE